MTRGFDPPGDYWEPQQQGELIDALKRAMRPHIRVARESGELETTIHDANQHGMQSLPLREKFFGWSPPLSRGTYKISTSGVDETLLLLNPGDRALVELVVTDGKVKFQPYRYTNFIVPATHPQLRAQDPRDLVQLALPKVVMQPTQRGGYDLDLLLLMDREFRGGTNLQMERPQFAWFEVRPGANSETRMADVENVNYYPAPAWKVHVP